MNLKIEKFTFIGGGNVIRHFRGKSALSVGDRWMAAAPSRPDKSSRKKEALSLQNRMKLLRHPHQSAVGQNRSSIVHLNRCIMHLSPHSLTHSRKNFSFFDALSAFTAARGGGAPRRPLPPEARRVPTRGGRRSKFESDFLYLFIEGES